MGAGLKGFKAMTLAGLALALATALWAQSTPSSTPPASTPTAQPAPGTTPVGGDTPAATPTKQPAPGTTPVGGDVPATAVNPDKVVEPGSQKINVKPGSVDDVSAVGNRDIGAPGSGEPESQSPLPPPATLTPKSTDTTCSLLYQRELR